MMRSAIVRTFAERAQLVFALANDLVLQLQQRHQLRPRAMLVPGRIERDRARTGA